LLRVLAFMVAEGLILGNLPLFDDQILWGLVRQNGGNSWLPRNGWDSKERVSRTLQECHRWSEEWYKESRRLDY